MVPENFIALLAQNNGAEARTVLEDGLSQIILNRLEERKRELAGGLFSGYATEPVQEEFEQLEEGISQIEKYPHTFSKGTVKQFKKEQRQTRVSDAVWDKRFDRDMAKKKLKESEQLDEISAGTAKSVGDKRHTQGLKFYGMSERSTDPLVKKVFAGKAEKLNKKAHNAYGYSFKKAHADSK